VPVNAHLLLVSTAGWQEQTGAVAARERVPCLVRAVFADGFEAEVEATASAWAEHAVQVYFSHPDPKAGSAAYRVWVPTNHVRRLPREVPRSA